MNEWIDSSIEEPCLGQVIINQDGVVGCYLQNKTMFEFISGFEKEVRFWIIAPKREKNERVD